MIGYEIRHDLPETGECTVPTDDSIPHDQGEE